MREYFTYGSVRGAAGDGGPYRDYQWPLRGYRNAQLQRVQAKAHSLAPSLALQACIIWAKRFLTKNATLRRNSL